MTCRIAVFGTGYLGATHAACMAELGHEVLGVDVDAGKLAKLESGEVPFYEPGLTEVLERNLEAGRLRFTSSYADAAEFADVHFIGVGTPPQKKGEFAADLTYVDSVIDQLAPLLTEPAVIFGKSTVPVGTAERLRARARQLALRETTSTSRGTRSSCGKATRCAIRCTRTAWFSVSTERFRGEPSRLPGRCTPSSSMRRSRSS